MRKKVKLVSVSSRWHTACLKRSTEYHSSITTFEVIRIWRDRGERMAEEAAAFQATKVLATTKGKSPAKGRSHNGGSRFSPKEHAMSLLNEARMLHGLIEETWRGGEVAPRKMVSGKSSFRPIESFELWISAFPYLPSNGWKIPPSGYTRTHPGHRRRRQSLESRPRKTGEIREGLRRSGETHWQGVHRNTFASRGRSLSNASKTYLSSI